MECAFGFEPWLAVIYIEPIKIQLTRGRGARMTGTQLFVASLAHLNVNDGV